MGFLQYCIILILYDNLIKFRITCIILILDFLTLKIYKSLVPKGTSPSGTHKKTPPCSSCNPVIKHSD